MKHTWSKGIRIALILFFMITVILPLIRMFMYIDINDLMKVISSRQFKKSLINSLYVTSAAASFSLLIAFILAWSVTRTRIKYKGLISVALVIPMLIPSMSHSTGLIMLFGTNGIVTKTFGLTGNIYGFWGIVLGSVMYSFPFAFLMIVDILKYENGTPYEAADILGVSRFHQVKDMTLPYLRKPLISVIFATFTIIFTDYGVPITIGGKFTTLPVVMYQEVIGQLNFSKGSVIGAVLLLPALVSFILDVTNKDRGNNSFIRGAYSIKPSRVRDAAAYIFCGLMIVFILTINGSFVILAFTANYPINLSLTLANVKKTFNMNGFEYLVNSLLISVMVTIVGTFIAFVTAYFTARMKSVMSKVLHLISITSLAIPGIVLGLSYVLFFKGSLIYGSIILLVMVNITHFTASPYLMIYNTFGKLNENLESVGQTLGINRLYMIRDVIIPQTKATILEMSSYLFVNSMITISAVSFLATTQNKPFSLMINQFDALMIVECSAVVSLILLGINILFKTVIYVIKRKMIMKELIN